MTDFREMLRAWAELASKPVVRQPRYSEPKPGPITDYDTWQKENVARIQARRARALNRQVESARKHLLEKYGLKHIDVLAMHHRQGGRCANPGCRVEIDLWGRERGIDHCHETGKVRGLLCRACNSALGQLYDDRERILGLAAYLEKFQK